jgi:hypothetical protein
MRSYIKIFGPPLFEAIEALEKISIDFPEVCIMDPLIHNFTLSHEDFLGYDPEWVQNYFRSSGKEISIERCDTLVSDSGEMLGEYDFFFEWFREPKTDELKDLIKKIDEALSPLGCKYTITTQK